MAGLDFLLPKRLRRDFAIVPVVKLTGAILPGGSAFRPNLNLAGAAPLLHKAFSIKQARAVAIAINSPGGSPVQSRLIFKRIRDLAREKDKQVLVFVEDVAASGGYMIALAGDEIFADPSSIVGSIGVVSASFGFPELLKKIGVERRVYTSGREKVTLDPFQPEKPADVAHLKTLQKDIHQTFIDLVKQRRGDRLTGDDETLFNGLFWSGTKGKELGLVDGIGDLRSILQTRFGEKVHLPLIAQPRGPFARRARGAFADSGEVSGRLAGADEFASSAVANTLDGVIAAAQERLLWSRYGL